MIFSISRYCYNKRADRADYRRLTFALIGVATPSDLIADKRRTLCILRREQRAGRLLGLYQQILTSAE
jgi:hypothetical protein